MGNTILYTLLLVWVKILAVLPMRVLYFLSDIFYVLTRYIARYRRKTVRKNMRQSFPDMTEKERKQLERRFYHHFSDYVVETIKLAGISQQELLKRAQISNPEVVLDLLDRGHSTFIMLMGHYGNWEWFSGGAPFFENRVSLYQIYRPLKNKAFDRLFLYIRTRFHSVGIKKKEAVRDIFKLNRDNIPAIVIFIADQSPSITNLEFWTNFLNQDSAIITGPERIAKKLDLPVIFADVQKIKRGYYTVEFKLITDQAKQIPDFEITAQYAQLMERCIKRDPAYWLWTHNRWKHPRPSNESLKPE